MRPKIPITVSSSFMSGWILPFCGCRTLNRVEGSLLVGKGAVTSIGARSSMSDSSALNQDSISFLSLLTSAPNCALLAGSAVLILENSSLKTGERNMVFLSSSS